MLGWSVVTALLFRTLGPRRATLITVIGGNLALPCLGFDMARGAGLGFTQLTAIGLAVVLGVLVVDPRGVWQMRPDWLDVPMIAYVAYPLTGLITHGRLASWDVADMILQRGFGTLVPYAAARRYLSDPAGAGQIAVAIVIATLLYVPVIAWEAVMGPPWYLGKLLYGAAPILTMANRLGGWRPEGFFLNGLTLATWMALAAVVATWLWLGRGWRPPRGPSWWPALVLVLASIGCRGVYGYIGLGLGLTAAAITRALRTRWVIVLLLLLAPLYIGLRVTGEWDARMLTRMAEVTGRAGTVDFRLRAEDAIIARVLERHPIVGFGVQIWHFANIRETLGRWPDGLWLITLWSGGLLGLGLHLAALFLLPAGLALAQPMGDHSRSNPAAPVVGLALFTALCMLDGLHNHSEFTPRALVAGSLVGMVVNRRRGTTVPHDERRTSRVCPSVPRPQPLVETSLIPLVTAMACLLDVFGNGPVADHEVVKLAGGLGAALLFAAAGGIGAWTSTLVPPTRLAVFAGLFAALGVSFNLALQPSSRPAATAGILQGLAACSLAVACWRRWVGSRAWRDAALVALPLVAHFLLRPLVPRVPGVQYVFDSPVGAQSLFPLFPWLAMAALGARATGQTAAASGAAASLLTAATALAWWSEPGSSGLVKFPMNLPYALLACASIEVAFTLAHALKGLGAVARAAAWLGRNWLIFFYVHFAIVFVLRWLAIVPAAVVWAVLAAGSIGATWLVVKALAPFSGQFKSPVAWCVPLALIVTAGNWPGLHPAAVSCMAGAAGLIFAAYHDTLAYVVVNFRWSRQHRPPRWLSYRCSGAPDALAGASGLGRTLARLAVILALLLLPEIVGLLMGTGVPLRFGR
jgi:hypothetical protein